MAGGGAHIAVAIYRFDPIFLYRSYGTIVHGNEPNTDASYPIDRGIYSEVSVDFARHYLVWNSMRHCAAACDGRCDSALCDVCRAQRDRAIRDVTVTQSLTTDPQRGGTCLVD